MVVQNYSLATIGNILGVSLCFVSKWKYVFASQGTAGLKLKYRGSKSYLNETQNQAVINWLKQKNYWHLEELKEYIEDNYHGKDSGQGVLTSVLLEAEDSDYAKRPAAKTRR
jgi:putative transposase